MWRLVFVVTLTALSVSVHANEPPPKQEPEKIPAPKAKIVPTIIVPTYTRTDTREVWQHYGVNAMGRFVPRVIVTPHGAYTSRDLQPYPWAWNRTTAILPR